MDTKSKQYNLWRNHYVRIENADSIWIHDKKDAETAKLELSEKHGKTMLTATRDRRWGWISRREL